jgi:condensin-2 complex subunit G2
METRNELDKGRLKVAAKALLASVEVSVADNDSNIEAVVVPFVRLFEPKAKNDFIADGLTPKKQEGMILDLIRTSHKNFVTSFFARLHPIIEVVVAGEAFVPPSAFLPNDDQNESEQTQTSDTSVYCLSLLKYSAMCTEAALERTVAMNKANDKTSQHPIQIAPQVYEVALQLHNVLLSLHDCGSEGIAARNAVLSLCESWWLSNAVNRDTLIAQVLPLQVLHASDPTDFQKSHIKKLLSFKDAFQVIDFLNPSSDSLRSLLLRIASNPMCLKVGEGRKFLASLFRDHDLILDLHLSFRVQIPNASRSILQAYAEIYHKAWCDADDASNVTTLEVLEHKVLQDLMHAAIHVASPAMAKALLIVLEPLHKDKKDKRVADLLWRLYSPILWRSLSAANPLVRKNAVTILGKVFPLHNPTHNQVRATIESSCAALETALQDADPRVRATASEATANVCALFWEALPSSNIRMLINRK